MNNDNKYKEKQNNEATEKYFIRPTEKYFTTTNDDSADNQIIATEQKSVDTSDAYEEIEIKSFVNLGDNVPVEASTKHGDKFNDEPVVYTFYSSTVKPDENLPFLNHYVDIGVEDVAAQASDNQTTTETTTTEEPALSTQSFFLQHNKLQEINLVDDNSVDTLENENDVGIACS